MKKLSSSINSIEIPSRTQNEPSAYVLKVLPLTESGRIAAIADNNTLNIFDPSVQGIFPGDNGIQIRDLHSDKAPSKESGLTCLEQIDASTVVTAGRDGFVSILDLRKAWHDISSQLASYCQLNGSLDWFDPANRPPRSINTMATSEWLIALGNEYTNTDPNIAVWSVALALAVIYVLMFDRDRRKWSKPLVEYYDFHSDEPTQVKSRPFPSPYDHLSCLRRVKPRSRKFRLPKVS